MTLLLDSTQVDAMMFDEADQGATTHQDLFGLLIAQINRELASAQYAATPADSRHLLTFMETEVIKGCRRSQDATFHLLAHHLHFYHGMLDIIMRDDAMPAPGSAHELLNKWLGIPAGMTLIHTKGGESEPRDCVVRIMLINKTR